MSHHSGNGNSVQDGNGGALYTVVVATNGRPTEIVMVFPSASSADTWAQLHGIDEYTVVTARFATTHAPTLR
ncbi:MAG: hypothetical protein ACQSGP_29480 [Frankia sp.]